MNNKGMAISSILYTLLVLFIALLFGILSIISAGNVTLSKLKNDIVDKLNGKETKNASIICKRATSLHTETCTQNSGTIIILHYYCDRTSYAKTTATYGGLGTAGTLTSGDAFDCDVNGDGTYDSATERFYYVSDYYNTTTQSFETDKAVLIYYSNTANGVASNAEDSLTTYDSSPVHYNGPVKAKEDLPTLSQWPNVRLINSTRAIIAEGGETSTKGGTLNSAFSYEGYAARLLTTKELESACGITVGSNTKGELDSCSFIMENTKFTNDSNATQGFWLETPYTGSTNTNNVHTIYSSYRDVGSGESDILGSYGVRPVIEIYKSRIEY